MPEKLKKMIGVVILVCSIGGVSCVGALGPSVERVMNSGSDSKVEGKAVVK